MDLISKAVKKRSRQLEERLSELEHRQIEESKKRIAAQKTNKRGSVLHLGNLKCNNTLYLKL